jgi:hypothetical protein
MVTSGPQISFILNNFPRLGLKLSLRRTSPRHICCRMVIISVEILIVRRTGQWKLKGCCTIVKPTSHAPPISRATAAQSSDVCVNPMRICIDWIISMCISETTQFARSSLSLLVFCRLAKAQKRRPHAAHFARARAQHSFRPRPSRIEINVTTDGTCQPTLLCNRTFPGPLL